MSAAITLHILRVRKNAKALILSASRFLGPYRSWDRPLAVEQGKCGNSIANGWQPMGSFHVRLSLQPGEQKQIIFLLGYHENPKDQKFDPPEFADHQ